MQGDLSDGRDLRTLQNMHLGGGARSPLWVTHMTTHGAAGAAFRYTPQDHANGVSSSFFHSFEAGPSQLLDVVRSEGNSAFVIAATRAYASLSRGRSQVGHLGLKWRWALGPNDLMSSSTAIAGMLSGQRS